MEIVQVVPLGAAPVSAQVSVPHASKATTRQAMAADHVPKDARHVLLLQVQVIPALLAFITITLLLTPVLSASRPVKHAPLHQVVILVYKHFTYLEICVLAVQQIVRLVSLLQCVHNAAADFISMEMHAQVVQAIAYHVQMLPTARHAP